MSNDKKEKKDLEDKTFYSDNAKLIVFAEKLEKLKDEMKKVIEDSFPIMRKAKADYELVNAKAKVEKITMKQLLNEVYPENLRYDESEWKLETVNKKKRLKIMFRTESTDGDERGRDSEMDKISKGIDEAVMSKMKEMGLKVSKAEGGYKVSE